MLGLRDSLIVTTRRWIHPTPIVAPSGSSETVLARFRKVTVMTSDSYYSHFEKQHRTDFEVDYKTLLETDLSIRERVSFSIPHPSRP